MLQRRHLAPLTIESQRRAVRTEGDMLPFIQGKWVRLALMDPDDAAVVVRDARTQAGRVGSDIGKQCELKLAGRSVLTPVGGDGRIPVARLGIRPSRNGQFAMLGFRIIGNIGVVAK